MNVGDYVRTEKGIIGKFNVVKTGETIPNWNGGYGYKEIDKEYIDNNVYNRFDDKIIKSSPNIIDLIEVGDYVNGLPVERIEGTLDDENDIRLWFGVATYGRTTLNQINHRYTVKDDFEDDYSLRFRCIKPEDIKSIVTKEQFEAIKYEIK